MPRPCLTLAALLLLAPATLADPFDKCGVFVSGLEGCVVFQPDDQGSLVLPDIASPTVGARARIRGDLVQCVSICFVPCVQGATATSCTVPPACPADFDGSGGLAPADIFAFLNAWFSGSISADFDHSGVLSVQDIFDFLNAWFAGCP